MELCTSHYSHKSIPNAKFEADSSSSFEDVTSQNLPWTEGMGHRIRLFIPENGFNLKKK